MFDHVPVRSAAADTVLTEKACAAVRELLGQVKLVEVGDAVFAEVNLARWYINHGTQESLPKLHPLRFVLV